MRELYSQIDAGPDGIADRQLQNYTREELTGALISSSGIFELGGQNTQAGVKVTNNSCLSYSPVAQAVTMISGDVARLPLHLYRRINADRLEPARELSAYRVFSHRPNQVQNWYEFWRGLMTQLLVWGKAYALMQRDRLGNIQSVYPLLSDRTYRVDESSYSFDTVVYQTEVDGQLLVFRDEQAIVLEGLTLDFCNPIDPVRQARETWAAGLAAIGFTSKFFGRGGRIGGVLELPIGLTPKARDTIEEGFRKTYEGPDAAFQTVILRENAKFHAAQHTLEQAQMIEGRREGIRDVARFFNLKPSRLGEESSASYGSKSEDNRDYLDTTLSPHLTMICAELTCKTLTPEQSWPTSPTAPRYYWEHDTSALLAMNMLERYQAYQIGVSNTWLSPNDVRRRESMNPRSGGDVYGNPATSSPNALEREDAAGKIANWLIKASCDAAEFYLEKIATKASNPQAFEKSITDYTEVRVDKVRASTMEAVEAYAAITGRLINVVEIYKQTVERALTWALDNVPAASLKEEFAAAKVRALDEFINKLRSELDDQGKDVSADQVAE